MPAKKPTKAQKTKAKKIAKGKKYVAKGKKVAVKSLGNQLSPKRRKQIKGQAQAATSENLIKAGMNIQKSAGQGELKKKSKLKVTPRSIKKSSESRDRYLKSQKKGAGRLTTKRPKRKR